MKNLLLITILLLTGCKETQLFEKKEETLRQLSANDIRINYIGLEEPSKYDVQLSWGQSKGYLMLKKNQNSFFDSSRQSHDNKYVFRNLDSGKKYSVIAESYSPEGNLLESTTLNLSVPLDYIFTGTVQLDRDYDINAQRVFFIEGTNINTMQYNLKISAGELIVGDGSRIQNFPDGAQAGLETTGLSAGNIEIRSFIARGNLAIVQNSQIGGAGYHGTHQSSDRSHCWMSVIEREIKDPPCHPKTIPACAGTSGADSGRLGDLKVFVDQSEEFNVDYKKVYVPGGSAGPHGNQRINGYPVKGKPKEQCNAGPSNGAQASGGSSCVMLFRSEIHDCE